MDKVLVVAADVHAKTVVALRAEGLAKPVIWRFENTRKGRAAVIAELRSAQGRGERVVFGYEASSCGYVLHDELSGAGIEVYVLAPHRIARSAKEKKNKTDTKDAVLILDALRSHLFAAKDLPAASVPDKQLRDDRELVRARDAVCANFTRAKVQIRGLLQRHGYEGAANGDWTRAQRRALEAYAARLSFGTRTALESLLRQLDEADAELKRLNQALAQLASTVRYEKQIRALTALPGVSAPA
jgi:transposase